MSGSPSRFPTPPPVFSFVGSLSHSDSENGRTHAPQSPHHLLQCESGLCISQKLVTRSKGQARGMVVSQHKVDTGMAVRVTHSVAAVPREELQT